MIKKQYLLMLFLLFPLASCNQKNTAQNEINYINSTCNLINKLGDKFNYSSGFKGYTKEEIDDGFIMKSANSKIRYFYKKVNDDYRMYKVLSYDDENFDSLNFYGLNIGDPTWEKYPGNYDENDKIVAGNCNQGYQVYWITSNHRSLNTYLYNKEYSRVYDKYFYNNTPSEVYNELHNYIKDNKTDKYFEMEHYTLDNFHVFFFKYAAYVTFGTYRCYNNLLSVFQYEVEL